MAPAAAAAAVPHVVGSGESLSSVAASDGLSVEQLAAANGLSSEATLAAGSTLMIPEQAPAGSEPSAGETTSSAESPPESSGSSLTHDNDGDGDDAGAGEAAGAGEGSSAAATAATTATSGSYVVQPGDTLSAIAARAGIGVAELATANGVDPNSMLLTGTVLTMPTASGEGAASHGVPSEGGQTASAQPVGTGAEGSESGPPFPTEQTVSPSEVGSIASENGVPPSLAEAVASQESGFNNGLTSSSDARGVMQILPGTWNWIGENLAGQTPLAPASAESNVRGGVLLLHSLLNETNGNPALAAAGYYQGLPSVLENGELPSTEEYVNSVLALQQQYGR
jgi:LysM repeat protein